MIVQSSILVVQIQNRTLMDHTVIFDKHLVIVIFVVNITMHSKHQIGCNNDKKQNFIINYCI